jgi:hypothetical protein
MPASEAYTRVVRLGYVRTRGVQLICTPRMLTGGACPSLLPHAVPFQSPKICISPRAPFLSDLHRRYLAATSPPSPLSATKPPPSSPLPRRRRPPEVARRPPGAVARPELPPARSRCLPGAVAAISSARATVHGRHGRRRSRKPVHGRRRSRKPVHGRRCKFFFPFIDSDIVESSSSTVATG